MHCDVVADVAGQWNTPCFNQSDWYHMNFVEGIPSTIK